MKHVYTIIPFATKTFPVDGTIGKIFFDHFYLFKVYTDSLPMLQQYIRYLDGNFDNVFSNMGFQIVDYKYPNKINYSSGQMIEWINDHYELPVGCSTLDISYELNTEVEFNQVLGKDITIMSNAFAPYDILQYGVGIFEDYDKWREIIVLANYVNDSWLSELICNLMTRIADYARAATALGYGVYEQYDTSYIHEQYFILYQQKVFIRKELMERSEDNESVCT